MTIQGGGVSKSATKAPWAGISREKKRGILTILFARSGLIRVFVADLDNLAPSRAPSDRRGVRHGLRSTRDALPEGLGAAPFVQICHKGPDRAGTPEENR